ncbi:YveK family protein [Priestia endophytica]|jgi:capsular polysaccharide biosynthesis protein|uniref:YveK family protein n=1 Tax=Priestia endophytica TaxID=135735 RepID=UPI002E1DCFA1|nr:Wzz/FepE/Etk N-terminal domain-containing protein [Priestia endophytica]MED4072349.1 Wzz/FepE/Etk N-terminal domain-containing protein [Priestia endophytica]
MEETISLRELFATLKKRLKLIIIITLAAGLISAIISYFVLTPVYQSSTQILVNQSKDGQQLYESYQIQTNLQLVNTYTVIMKSPAVLDKVKEQLDYQGSLAGKIQVTSEQDSQVLSVTVQDSDPELAAKIASTTATVFKSEIAKIMKVDNVTILSVAQIPDYPIKPNKMLNVAIALVVGLMAGVGLAFLLEYLDNTIKNENDIEELLGLPVMGAVAKVDGNANPTKQPKLGLRKTRRETYGA